MVDEYQKYMTDRSAYYGYEDRIQARKNVEKEQLDKQLSGWSKEDRKKLRKAALAKKEEVLDEDSGRLDEEPKSLKKLGSSLLAELMPDVLKLGGSMLLGKVLAQDTDEPSFQSGVLKAPMDKLKAAQEIDMQSTIFENQKGIERDYGYGKEGEGISIYKQFGVTPGGERIDLPPREYVDIHGEKSFEFLMSSMEKERAIAAKEKGKERQFIGKEHHALDIGLKIPVSGNARFKQASAGNNLLEILDLNSHLYEDQNPNNQVMKTEIIGTFENLMSLNPIKSELKFDIGGIQTQTLTPLPKIFEELKERYPWLEEPYRKFNSRYVFESKGSPYGQHLIEVIQDEHGEKYVFRPLGKFESDAKQNKKYATRHPNEYKWNTGLAASDTLVDVIGDDTFIPFYVGAFLHNKQLGTPEGELQRLMANNSENLQKEKNVAIAVNNLANNTTWNNSALLAALWYKQNHNNEAFRFYDPKKFIESVANSSSPWNIQKGVLGGADLITMKETDVPGANKFLNIETQYENAVYMGQSILEDLRFQPPEAEALTNLAGDIEFLSDFAFGPAELGGLKAIFRRYLGDKGEVILNKAANVFKGDAFEKFTLDPEYGELSDDIATSGKSRGKAANIAIYEALADAKSDIREALEDEQNTFNNIIKRNPRAKKAMEEFRRNPNEDTKKALAESLRGQWNKWQATVKRAGLRAKLVAYVFSAAVIFQGGSGGKAVSDQDRQRVENALQSDNWGTEAGMQAAIEAIHDILTKAHQRTSIQRLAKQKGLDPDKFSDMVKKTTAIMNDEEILSQVITAAEELKSARPDNPQAVYDSGITDWDEQMRRKRADMPYYSMYKEEKLME